VIETGLPQIVSGAIDLVFQEPEGWVIADYKTDAGNLLQALTRAINNRDFLSSIDEDSLDVIKEFMEFLKKGAFRIS
jgi:hypothetical protein